MRVDPHQELVMDLFQNFLPPAQYPTWHERSYAPGTPQSMWFLLQDEAGEGCEGEFGHTFWAERHPAFTDKLQGYVWLPGIKFHEVPGHMRGRCVIDYRDGRVFLRAIVDSRIGAPAWA